MTSLEPHFGHLFVRFIIVEELRRLTNGRFQFNEYYFTGFSQQVAVRPYAIVLTRQAGVESPRRKAASRESLNVGWPCRSESGVPP